MPEYRLERVVATEDPRVISSRLKDRVKQVRTLLKQIDSLVVRNYDPQVFIRAKKTPDWGHVGDLDHVIENLEAILEFLPE